jgi:hypothetical protein
VRRAVDLKNVNPRAAEIIEARVRDLVAKWRRNGQHRFGQGG